MKNPRFFLVKEVLYMSFSVMDIWWYQKYPFRIGIMPYHCVSKYFIYKGKGYEFFLVIAFVFLKSTQILSLLFFLVITTIGDNQMGPTTLLGAINALFNHCFILKIFLKSF
jgi:hypothetical protein